MLFVCICALLSAISCGSWLFWGEQMYPCHSDRLSRIVRSVSSDIAVIYRVQVCCHTLIRPALSASLPVRSQQYQHCAVFTPGSAEGRHNQFVYVSCFAAPGPPATGHNYRDYWWYSSTAALVKHSCMQHMIWLAPTCNYIRVAQSMSAAMHMHVRALCQLCHD